MRKHCSHGDDFLVGNWSSNTSRTQEAVHPVGAQNLNTRSLTGRNSHENIARKQRDLDQTLSIAPSVPRGKKREKNFDTFFLKLTSNLFLVAESSLNGKPSERPGTYNVERWADRGTYICTGLKYGQDKAPP